MAFFLRRLVRKLERFYFYFTSVRTAILSSRAIYVQCFVYSPLHVRLRVTHALKGHLYDCVCMRRGLGRGYSMCTRVRAQTVPHERQGGTLDYSPIEY